MNLRGHAPLHHPGIQLAPLVDVLLLLLIFFLLTWNAARTENELDVKVPKASAAREKSAPIGDVVVNVKADGNVVVNRRTLSGAELTELLKSLVQLNAEQAVVIAADDFAGRINSKIFMGCLAPVVTPVCELVGWPPRYSGKRRSGRCCRSSVL